jgi:predicted site-specific integrase-resolvase
VYEDLDALLPGALAAKRAKVSRQLVHYWRTSGHLPVAEYRDGRPYYRVGDVLKAAAATRKTRRSSRYLDFSAA